MKKVIIRTRGQVLTPTMLKFGNRCVDNFVNHLKLKTYGEDWNSCAYSNGAIGMSGWAELRKSGTISVLVIQAVVDPCN